MAPVLLGLIGDNIRRSKSPLLHRLAGELCGLEVIYQPLIPAQMGSPFDEVFETCRTDGYRGINITYPYKEHVVAKLQIDDPQVAAIAASNTVLFGDGKPMGFNTDFSGFVAAFRNGFPGASPGVVALAGAGGVGRAISFAIDRLGATELRLFDPDRAKAESLSTALALGGGSMDVIIAETIADAVSGADGVVNCTPLGMAGHPGTAFPYPLLPGRRWAFDAVYTPVETQFLLDARRARLETLTGYELFFHQGVDAFHLFTGQSVDTVALRDALTREAMNEGQPI